MRGEVRQPELLRVVGFENDGHDVWVPFGCWVCFGFDEDTKKPGLVGAGLFRVGDQLIPVPSAGIVGGRVLGDDAGHLAVLVGQTFAHEPARESRHRDTFSLGLVVEPRDQVAIEPGRVSTGRAPSWSPSVEVDLPWGRGHAAAGWRLMTIIAGPGALPALRGSRKSVNVGRLTLVMR